MSASRLAAEAAFAAPQFSAPPPSQAQVTIRKARVAVFAAQPVVTDEGLSAMEPATQGPRVFRVEAPQAGHSTQAMGDALHEPLAASAGDADAVVAVVPRSRRAAADKRPGPVLHVVHALPARPLADAAAPSLRGLIAELASVGPTLDAIRCAQSFEIVDRRAEIEYQRLSRLAEDIRSELDAYLR